MKRSRIEWSTAGERRDAVYGDGVTRAEKSIALGTAVAGTAIAVVLAAAAGVSWNALQWAVAVVIAFDLLGGVVANGLNSAKRAHFGPAADAPAPGPLARLTRRPVLFAAVHVQPIIVSLVFPPHEPWWGLGCWAVVLISVVAVRAVPLHLERPVALAACVVIVLASTAVAAPVGFAWLPAIMALKLVLAHAVQEEPYRPS